MPVLCCILGRSFFFWFLVPAGVFAVIIRQINTARWVASVKSIASDKINHLMLSLKELAYSSLIGAGAYWGYACMAKGLGVAIAEAAQRPVLSAKAISDLVRWPPTFPTEERER